MTNRPETTRVNIYGREYSIRGEGDPAYIAEIAHFLDMRMRQMTENVAMASTAKVSILASLNITDELFSKKRQLEEMEDSHQVLLSSLADRIDTFLADEDSSQRHSGAIRHVTVKNGTEANPVFQKSGPGSSSEERS